MGPFGKKQMDQLAAFTGTLICYSIASALNIIYITDWKAVSMYIPFYGGKFFPKAPPSNIRRNQFKFAGGQISYLLKFGEGKRTRTKLDHKEIWKVNGITIMSVF